MKKGSLKKRAKNLVNQILARLLMGKKLTSLSHFLRSCINFNSLLTVTLAEANASIPIPLLALHW